MCPEGWYWILHTNFPHQWKTCLTCQGPWESTFGHSGRAPSLLLLHGSLGCPLWAGFLLNLACGVGTFTLGVLGPWDWDCIFAQALPVWLPSWLWTELTRTPHWCWLPWSFPDTPHALATFLAHKHVVAAFVGPVNPGYSQKHPCWPKAGARPSASGRAGLQREAVSWGPLCLRLPRCCCPWDTLSSCGCHVLPPGHLGGHSPAGVARTLRTHGLPVVLVSSLGPGGQGPQRY